MGIKVENIFKTTRNQMIKMSIFEDELEKLINRFSIENESDTADFILATYIRHSLDAFSVAVKHRDRWNKKMKLTNPTIN